MLCSRALLMLVLLSASSAAVAGGCFEATNRFFSPEDWLYCQPLDEDNELFMYYNPLPKQGNVMLGLHAAKDTFGWSSLALAGNGGMKGASQIVVRRHEDDGEWIAEDRNSQAYTTPALDESQDVKLLFAEQDSEEGETAWAVLLPMRSCDTMDYPLQDISVYMHWALGETHTFAFHGSRRGQFHANLFREPHALPAYADTLIEDSGVALTSSAAEASTVSTQEQETIVELELVMPDVKVVLGEGGQDPTNPYLCTFFDLAELVPHLDANTTVHVTRMAPVLNEASKKHVHHMILYSCENQEAFAGGNSQRVFEHGNVLEECQSMPSGCSIMKWPWAVGAEEAILPPDVGIPLGGEGENRNWLGLQMHYYNPELHENVFDSSGVKLYYTEDIRPHEAGYLQVNGGTSAFMRDPIPAGQTDYEIPTFVVPSSCTAEAWDGPLNILGVGHHMHMTGTKMEIEVERDGQNLGPLRYEKHYDFNHQSAEPTAIRTLQPGDQLNVHCNYDTSRLSEDVSFGDLTQQEMCYSVLFYYPKQERDNFGILPPFMNSTLCTTGGQADNDLFVDVSLCAQNAFENVPAFYGFEDAVEAPFDGLFLCNSDFYESTIMPISPGICPDCYKNKTCTAEEVIAHAQNGICLYRCHNWAGVSVYPDVSRAENFDQGMWGCGLTDLADIGLHFFKKPELEEFTCQAVGDLSQEIELQAPSTPSTAEEEATPEELSSVSSRGSSFVAGLVWFLMAGNAVWMV